MKGIIIAAVVFCVGLIGLTFYLATQDSGSGPRVLPLDQKYVDRQKNKGWTEGATTPKVEVLEYGDIQCPACAAANPVIQQAMAATTDIARLTYRHYPLTSIHDKALQAAKVTEAAGRQGKFWEMQQLMFANQPTWSAQTASQLTTTSETYASTLSLNVDQFKQDMKDSSLTDEINNDRKAGDEVPIQHTPTVLINGKEIDQVPGTADGLVALIKAAAGQ